MSARNSDFEQLSDDEMIRVNRLCNEFEERWRRGEEPEVEEVMDSVGDAARQTLLSELLPIEISYRRQAGVAVSIDQYVQRFPSVDKDWLAAIVQEIDRGRSPEIPARLGDYTIVRRIGSGGMGTVYQANHERMGRTVAIKVLRPELAVQPQTMERFVREIRAVAKLSHPNVVAAYDSREENGMAYLVTEFIEGVNLSTLVKQRGPLPGEEAVQYVLQAAAGLQYAHEQGIVHRDIKPANLMLAESAIIKILDLGLARLRTAEDSEMTKTDMLMGTAAYMAPEQARRPKEADHRADIYSLGCTLYYLLTGAPVYAGDSVLETALAHAHEPVPTLSDLRPDVADVLNSILGRMLAKDPADRIQSMAEVIAELQRVASTYDGLPRPSTSTQIRGSTALEGHRTSSTRRYVFAVGGILMLLAIAAIGFAFWNPNAEPRSIGPNHPPRDERKEIENTTPADHWALSFNGKTSYVEAASPGIASEPVTMEAIVTVHEAHIGVVVVWFHGEWHAGLGVNLYGQWGLGYCRANTNELPPRYIHLYADTAEQVHTDQRIHLAAVFNGDELRFYVNGKERQLNKESGPPFGVVDRVYIGRNAPEEFLPGQDHPDRFFNGLIHAVRISNSVRYTSDFKPPEVLDAEPGDDSILVFNFEEGAGSETHDVLGRATARMVDAEWVQP